MDVGWIAERERTAQKIVFHPSTNFDSVRWKARRWRIYGKIVNTSSTLQRWNDVPALSPITQQSLERRRAPRCENSNEN
jgi:hypothetical protein